MAVANDGWLDPLIAQQRPWLTDVVENTGHLQLGYAKGIAAVIGADSTACRGVGAHSPAGDSLSRKAAGDTCPAICADSASFDPWTGQAQETQAQ